MADILSMEQEILAEMEAGTYEQEEKEQIFVIDSDLRTIKIPPDVTLLGVYNDKNVKRFKFSMPKTYGELELSEFDIKINYRNRKKINNNYVADAISEDFYIVEDKNVIENRIEFSWLVGRSAVKYTGDTQFNVCMKKTDVDGVVEKELNTTWAVLPVLDGLEVEQPSIEEEEIDAISQMLKTVKSQTDQAVANVKNAEQEALDNIGTGVDSSLTEYGKAADAGVTGKEISELKGDLTDKVSKTDYAPETKTDSMSQPVGKDENGKLWTAPSFGDSSIAVTGATVGQTVKIAAVDENGVPTVWDPVDFPGVKEWQLITDVTIPEEDASITLFVNQDDNGNPFSVSEICITWIGIQVTDGTTSGNAWISINAEKAGYNAGKNGFISSNYFYYTSQENYRKGEYIQVIPNMIYAKNWIPSDEKNIHSVEVSGYQKKSFWGRVVIYGR